MPKHLFSLIIFLTFFIILSAEFEVIDEDSILDSEEHLYFMLERLNIQTATRAELAEMLELTDQDITNILTYRRRHVIINTSFLLDAGLSRETIENILPFIEFGRSRKLDFRFINYLRYQDSTDNFRTINRLEAKNNVIDLRLHQEYNTASENTPLPFGASLSIRRSPTGRLVLGQYQLNHAYGLSLSRGSFISQKPGFNTDFRYNRTILSANVRPYYSRSFFGAAYEKAFSEYFSMVLFASYKDTGARISDGQIDRLLIDERYPKETVPVFSTGSVASFHLGNLNLSGVANFTTANSKPLSQQSTTSYQITATSLAASYSFDRYLLFSETAYSNNAFANMTGIRNSFQRFTQLLVYRHFANGYEAVWGDYVSNSSTGTNESGLFYKIEYRTREYFIQTFADLFDNIDNNERYMDRNQGVSWGLNVEKYGLFLYNEMGLAVSYRQKTDKEWRNLSGISRYEDRKREYFKATWTQTNTRTLRTRLVFNYQTREYADYDIKNDGYAISQNINLQFLRYRIAFSGGVFDTEIPIYLYLYSGRLNNSMFVLNGEGQYVMIHFHLTHKDNLTIELMSSVLSKDIIEYNASVVVGWGF